MINATSASMPMTQAQLYEQKPTVEVSKLDEMLEARELEQVKIVDDIDKVVQLKHEDAGTAAVNRLITNIKEMEIRAQQQTDLVEISNNRLALEQYGKDDYSERMVNEVV